MMGPAQIKYIALTILLVLASVSFTRTTFQILKSSQRLEDIKKEVRDLEEQKKTLNESIEYKKTDEYIEQRARDDLNLVKPGEKVYVVEGMRLSTDKDKNQVLSAISINEEKKRDFKDSNAYLWYKLFFK